MPSSHRRLRPGLAVWVWYCNRACRAVIERRGLGRLRRYWVLRIDLDGATCHDFFERFRIHLCEPDARNTA